MTRNVSCYGNYRDPENVDSFQRISHILASIKLKNVSEDTKRMSQTRSTAFRGTKRSGDEKQIMGKQTTDRTPLNGQ